MLLITPREDWAADQDYTVTVLPGVETIAGEAVRSSYSFAFHTYPAPQEPVVDAQPQAAAEALACGCQSAGGSWFGVWMVGALGALARRRRGTPHHLRETTP